jgi:hypothetical protein
VGVYATTTTTDLFFRQAVGRFVRWVPGVRDQRAWLYLPDDPRLRIRAAQIADQRRHSLRRERSPDGAEDQRSELLAGADVTGEQLSMFAALSAVATGEAEGGSPWHEALPDDADGGDGTIEVELAPPPPLASGAGAESGLTRRQAKDRLRLANAEAARAIARTTGRTYAQVNLELNRLAGIRRVTEATGEELDRRLRHAERWWGRLGG